jgi:8-oxo-dGTP pyrophosphatase MutT (NUDIX family)
MFSRICNALFLTAKLLLSRVVLGVNALVLDADGRVLLVRHGYQRGWRLPGGGVDIGETPQEAIRRELQEELGLSGGTCTLAGTFICRFLWVGNVVVLYRVEQAKLDFRPSWEVREIVWADPAAPPPGLSPATARRLAELVGAATRRDW